MIKIVKFLYGLSVLIFLFLLLYVYAFLPAQVSLLQSGGGDQLLQLDKSDFFYWTLGLFSFTNVIIIVYRKLNAPHLNLYNEEFDEMTFSERLYHWLNGLSFVFNLIFSFSLLFIGMYNNSEDFDISDYAAMIYIGPIFLIGWFFWFIYLQLFVPKK